MKRIQLYFLYSIAYSILLYGYYAFVIPYFGYYGFEWSPNPIKITESIGLLYIILIFMPTEFKKPSDFLLHLQLLLPILGMLIIYGFANKPRLYTYIVTTCFLLIVFVSSTLRVASFRIIRFSSDAMQKMLLVLAILIIGSIFAFGGMRFINFNLLKVYKFRHIAAANLPWIYGYLSPMVSKVLLPSSLILSVINKNWISALASIVGSVLIFALTSNKGPLFYPFFALAIFFVLKRKDTLRMFVIGYVSAIALPMLCFLYVGKGFLINSLFLRRVYFDAGNTNYMYYNFFSSHPFVSWAQSKLTFGAISYPYSLDVPHLIGLNYFSSALAGANTGWIGSGYMELGYVGMIIYSLLIGVLFAFLNAYSKSMDKRVVVAVMIVPILSVIMWSNLTTAFLTHGVILSLMVISSFVHIDRGVL